MPRDEAFQTHVIFEESLRAEIVWRKTWLGWQASFSPNRHPKISSSGKLLDLVEHVTQVTGKPTGFKTVIGGEDWLDELCEEIKRQDIESTADFITVGGAEGGSGAAKMTLIDYVGLPIRDSLLLLVDKLTKHGLRDRVKVIASGALITLSKVALDDTRFRLCPCSISGIWMQSSWV